MIDKKLTPRQQLLSLPDTGKILILHHWDTDGLVSAALFLNFFAAHKPAWKEHVMHPTIGNYFLTKHELQKIQAKDYDLILSVDLNFPLETIEALEHICDQVMVFDHHVQTQGIDRPGKQDTGYPGNTFLVNEVLGNKISLLAVLGMVGDQEERIMERKDFYPYVETIIKQYGLSFSQLLHMTKLIDANYITLDSSDMIRTISLLRKDPVQILHDATLAEKMALIQKTLDLTKTAVGEPVGKFGLEFTLESPLHLLSEFTRAISRRFPKKIVMVTQIHKTYANVYLRRRNLPFDLSLFVDLARTHGYNAGGKVEVAGLIIPLDGYAEFSQLIRDTLQKYGT